MRLRVRLLMMLRWMPLECLAGLICVIGGGYGLASYEAPAAYAPFNPPDYRVAYALLVVIGVVTLDWAFRKVNK